MDLTHLATFPLFQGLTPSEIKQVEPYLRRQSYPAGNILLSAEQPGEVSYLIIEGTVKVHLDQADGTNVILAILGPGEIVGEMSLIESQPRAATVATLDACILYWIDRSALIEVLQTIPTLSLNLLRLLSRRLRLANEQIAALSTKDSYGRVARQILAFAQQYGRPTDQGSIFIPLRLTQSDLASLTGITRVSINRVLSHYKTHNVLSISPQLYITVHNVAALEQRCL